MVEWLPAVRTGESCDGKGQHKAVFLVDDTVDILPVVMVTGIYICVKMDRTVHQNEKVKFLYIKF